jgi:hypothetical protein
MRKLDQTFFMVKLEMGSPDLFEILRLLSEHQRDDLVKGFITQLRVEEYISQEDAVELAIRYGVEPPSYP